MVYLPIDYLPKKSQRTIHVAKYTSPMDAMENDSISFWGQCTADFHGRLLVDG